MECYVQGQDDPFDYDDEIEVGTHGGIGWHLRDRAGCCGQIKVNNRFSSRFLHTSKAPLHFKSLAYLDALIGQKIFPDHDEHGLVTVRLIGTRVASHYISRNKLGDRKAVFDLLHMLYHLDELAFDTLVPVHDCAPISTLIATTLREVYGRRVRLHAEKLKSSEQFLSDPSPPARFHALQQHLVQFRKLGFDAVHLLPRILSFVSQARAVHSETVCRTIQVIYPSLGPMSDIDVAVNVSAAFTKVTSIYLAGDLIHAFLVLQKRSSQLDKSDSLSGVLPCGCW